MFVKWFERNCWASENVDLLWLSTHLKIRSGPVQKDNPVIRMALSLPSVSLANTDEHRTNAWIGLDMDRICLLFAGPEETFFQ